MFKIKCNVLSLALLLSSMSLSVVAAPDIKDCNTQQTKEIAQAIDWGAANWKQFEAFLETKMDVNVKNCLENRFKKNGKVVCESKSSGMCKSAAGWASPLNKKCHMCPGYLTTVAALPKNVDRKGCYFVMVAHELAHTCERGHKKIDTMDNLAFDFWKKKHSDFTLTTMTQCGMALNQ